MADVADSTTLPEKTPSFPVLKNYSINAKQYSDLLDTFKAIQVILSGIVNQKPRLSNSIEIYLQDFIDIINAEMTVLANGLKTCTPENEDEAQIKAYALIKHEADVWNLSISQIAALAFSFQSMVD